MTHRLQGQCSGDLGAWQSLKQHMMYMSQSHPLEKEQQHFANTFSCPKPSPYKSMRREIVLQQLAFMSFHQVVSPWATRSHHVVRGAAFQLCAVRAMLDLLLPGDLKQPVYHQSFLSSIGLQGSEIIIFNKLSFYFRASKLVGTEIGFGQQHKLPVTSFIQFYILCHSP